MIFRYLLPNVVHAKHFEKRQTAVMMVNRQFYMEASAIVCGELRFGATVHPTHIAIFGKSWLRESNDLTYVVNLDKLLCQAGARRMLHLEVTIHFGDKHNKTKGIGVAGVSQEDCELYQARDTVRKLVQLVTPESLDLI
jgi:hypothetical protein